MRFLTDEGEAMNQLVWMVEGNTAPVLDAPELQQCLDNARRACLWVADANYSEAPLGVGITVQPTAANANGHRYRLIRFDGEGTTSGSTEPTWTTWYQGIVSDGNLTWMEDGASYSQLWDMEDAASRAWTLKAGKTATCVDFKQDGVGFMASQVHDHCVEMAVFYQSAQIA